MRRYFVLYAVLILNSLVSPFLFAANKANSNSDLPEVHLVVDVSGSMKKTDPLNLRVKSISMFIYLIKQKVRMSMDVFATDVKDIIPTTLVDANYVPLFQNKQNTITSDGAYTNIESALNHANKSWKSDKEKIIVLLTDGHVDLGSEPLSSASKNRVTTQTIKALAEQKVRVFTIGFSDETDKDLLTKIAVGTNGIAQIIKTSDDIDDTLYKIFTAIIPINGAPIRRNPSTERSFTVDKNIQHVTLIFKKNTSIWRLNLISPNGTKTSVLELSKTNDDSLNYKFVDLDKPQIGEWMLSGPEQEIERAVILTNVTLLSTFTSGVYFMQQHLLISNHLEDSGQLITEPLIVENLNMKFKMINGIDQYAYSIPYLAKGQFNSRLIFESPPGKYSVTLAAKSNYFSRELQFVVDLQPNPFKQTVNSDRSITIELLHPDLINPDTVVINALVNNQPLHVPVIDNDIIWQVDATEVCNKSGVQKIAVQIKAKRNDDSDIEFILPEPAASLCPVLVSQLEPIPPEQISLITPITFPPHQVKVKTADKPTVEKKDQKKFNYKVLVYGISILVLLIMGFGLAFIGWMAYAKKIKEIKNELQKMD
jgi:hypothetical protein